MGRRLPRLTLCATVTLLAFAFLASPAYAEDCSDDGMFCTEDDSVSARLESVLFTPVPSRPNPKIYHYSSSCYIDEEVRTADGCINGIVPEPPEACESGSWILPRWARLRDGGNGTPGPWVLEAGYTCPGDDLHPVTIEDVRTLPIHPSPVNIQPANGWVYAGIDTIAFTEDAPQGFDIILLGRPFQIGVIPKSYSWDFGDGSDPIVTEDIGKPYPNQTIAHRYRAAGTATPVLTTYWEGWVRNGPLEPWGRIPGTGETVTTGPELTIYTGRTRLVEDDLNG